MCFPSSHDFIDKSLIERTKVSVERRIMPLYCMGIFFQNWDKFTTKPGSKSAKTGLQGTIVIMAQFYPPYLEKRCIMVSLDDFRLMTFEKKCDLITFSGSYLTQRTLDDCNVFLYQSNNFFIEVFYSARHKRVLMINAFDKVFGLEPYLEEISIEELIV